MKMKDLKMYVSPETEILDMEIEEPLLEVSIEHQEPTPYD